MLTISGQLIDAVVAHARADHPDEACGIIAGPLNYIHPNRVQVIGPAELEYLHSLEPAARQQALQQLFDDRPAAVVLVHGIEVPAELPGMADAAGVALAAMTIRGGMSYDPGSGLYIAAGAERRQREHAAERRRRDHERFLERRAVTRLKIVVAVLAIAAAAPRGVARAPGRGPA